MAIPDTIRARRHAILLVTEKYGARQVRVFGSFACGEPRPDSDLNLLVTWVEGTSLFDHFVLADKLENLLGLKVAIASDGWVKKRLRESVYRDAIPL
jgi:hypothetical protein